MNLELRQAEISDRAAIARFLAKAYVGRDQWKYPERWEWQYVANPFNPDDRLPIWIALAGDEVIGQTCVTHVPMRIDGRDRIGSYGTDTIVLPEYRGRIGMALQGARHDAIDFVLCLWAAEAAIAMYDWLELKPMRAVEELCFDCRGARAEAGTSRVDIEPVSSFDHRTDDLWSRLAPGLEPLVSRNAAYLRWKYTCQPFMRYEPFYALRDGVDRGLLILRQFVAPEPNAGVIAELLCDPDDREVRSACIAFAKHELSRRGCDSIVASTSEPRFAEDYRAAGFATAGEEIPFVPERWDDFQVAERQAWFISQGDGDGDQFPRGGIRMTLRGLLPRRE